MTISLCITKFIIQIQDTKMEDASQPLFGFIPLVAGTEVGGAMFLYR